MRDVPVPIDLTREEIDVLMAAVARGVDPASTATTAQEASAVLWRHADGEVWANPTQRRILCSLATMFAEVTS